MTTKDRRDLHADLAICNAATAGPWRTSPDGRYSLDIVSIPEQVVICSTDSFGDGAHDARFIAEARTGWPHAIERALAAESILKSHGPDGRNYTNQEYVDMQSRAVRAESEVERLRTIIRHMEPCVDYDKSPLGTYLWREVMGVVTDDSRT